MPTILSHPVVPLALAAVMGRRAVPGRLLMLGIAASVIPDLDVLAFRLGVDYAHEMGHRGITHSICFALCLALATLPLAHGMGTRRRWVLGFMLACGASHGLLDMLTNGGLGVAWFWPFSAERHFLPCQVIEASPLSLRRFWGPAGLTVLKSELLWLWLPGVAVMGATHLVRHRRASRLA